MSKRNFYRMTDVDAVVCGNCGGPLVQLAPGPEWPAGRPGFHICWRCHFVFQVGLGPVVYYSDTEKVRVRSAAIARLDKIDICAYTEGVRCEMVKPFSGPNYRRNSDRVPADRWPCGICGKATDRDAPGIHSLNIINGGADFGPWNADANDPGFMGGYPIGPECWRKNRLYLAQFLPPKEKKA